MVNKNELVPHPAVILGDGTTEIQYREGIDLQSNNKIAGISIIPKNATINEVIHIYSTTKESIDVLIKALELAKGYLDESMENTK